MENYEEKYNKLLEHVNNLYNRLVGSEKEYLQQVIREEIPELVESDDEKIRKEIISVIKEYDRLCISQQDPFEDTEKCLAWLEKQKEFIDKEDGDFTIYHPVKKEKMYQNMRKINQRLRDENRYLKKENDSMFAKLYNLKQINNE